MLRAILPLLVIACYQASISVATYRANHAAPPITATQASQAGQRFVAYTQATQAYMRLNPSFTGSLNPQQLATVGHPLPSDFLALVGNSVTVSSRGGRVITTYGNLPAGAAAAVGKLTEGDMSFGVSHGSTWSSNGTGGVTSSLPFTVAAGSVVSVITLGQ